MKFNCRTVDCNNSGSAKDQDAIAELGKLCEDCRKGYTPEKRGKSPNLRRTKPRKKKDYIRN